MSTQASNKRRILIVGGGTAGWLTAAYLARHLALSERSHLEVTVLESPDIGPIGVGEGTFPTIRATLQFLGIDERRFIRETAATFKQGIRFVDWAAPAATYRSCIRSRRRSTPRARAWCRTGCCRTRRARVPFAQAVTLQARVAAAQRAPKRGAEAAYAGPLNYAYHFDALKLARLLAERARELGVQHVEATLASVSFDERGAIAHVDTLQHGRFQADLYIDCTGFRAETDRARAGRGIPLGARRTCSPTARSPASCRPRPTRRWRAAPSPRRTRPAGPGRSA